MQRLLGIALCALLSLLGSACAETSSTPPPPLAIISSDGAQCALPYVYDPDEAAIYASDKNYAPTEYRDCTYDGSSIFEPWCSTGPVGAFVGSWGTYGCRAGFADAQGGFRGDAPGGFRGEVRVGSEGTRRAGPEETRWVVHAHGLGGDARLPGALLATESEYDLEEWQQYELMHGWPEVVYTNQSLEYIGKASWGGGVLDILIWPVSVCRRCGLIFGFTLELWLRPAGLNTAGTMTQYAITTHGGFRLGVFGANSELVYTADGLHSPAVGGVAGSDGLHPPAVGGVAGSGAPMQGNVLTEAELELGAWTHVALVYDGSRIECFTDRRKVVLPFMVDYLLLCLCFADERKLKVLRRWAEGTLPMGVKLILELQLGILSCFADGRKVDSRAAIGTFNRSGKLSLGGDWQSPVAKLSLGGGGTGKAQMSQF
ncbi:hypothetical protein T492DRAFT_848556 [Pavlovales sp. CCMP2436]|nr:hypothetical protein T492DRAFT_848556 [Pavlovales sp. CCMP2436]